MQSGHGALRVGEHAAATQFHNVLSRQTAVEPAGWAEPIRWALIVLPSYSHKPLIPPPPLTDDRTRLHAPRLYPRFGGLLLIESGVR